MESDVGRIIQRMMRDTVRGLRDVVESVRRNCGMEEEEVRERMWRVQIGILIYFKM